MYFRTFVSLTINICRHHTYPCGWLGAVIARLCSHRSFVARYTQIRMLETGDQRAVP